MAEGNRHLGYKAALNAIEEKSPGSKASFYLNFVERMAPLLARTEHADRDALGSCERCGAPTPSGVCAFCVLQERSSIHEAVPVEFLTRRRGRGAR